MPNVSELTGRAREVFEMWRSLGLNEAQAMRDVVEAGLVEPDADEQMQGHFRGLGMSESAARAAARGRPGSAEWAPPPVRVRPGGMRSAWSWAEDVEPTVPTPSAETRERGNDRELQEAFDRAVVNAQRVSGLTAEQADELVRRRMTEACHQLVTESYKGKGR